MKTWLIFDNGKLMGQFDLDERRTQDASMAYRKEHGGENITAIAKIPYRSRRLYRFQGK